MGIVRTPLQLANPVLPGRTPLEVTALADTGSMLLYIPEHVAIQMGFRELERREVTLADGSRRAVSYVGPVEIRFANWRCFTGAMVMGDDVLLGAIPMEDLDVVVHPLTRTVTVNPDSPNVPTTIAKHASGRELSAVP
jgi:clan AA aspartic protease